MKEVLEYTKEELIQLSDDELNILLREAESKESLYNVRQLVEKTLINGLYGTLGNKWFSLFNEEMASAITGNGRYFIQKLARYIEDGLQKHLPQEKPYIVYGDTDSVYYHVEPFIEAWQLKNPNATIDETVDFVNTFEMKIVQPLVDKTIEDFAHELNAYNQEIIGAEREIIADAAVFTAKKKYYARVRDSEGTRYPEDDPYMKVMGLEIKKSSTPKWSQQHLEQAIPVILDSDQYELQDWLAEVKSTYTDADLAMLAGVGGVSNLDYKLGDKGVPIGSRAALVHNEYIKKHNLIDKYSPINAGDKTKRLFLIEPNPFNSNIIAFTNDAFVNEIKDYIDYDTNFEKYFLNPLEIMVNALKWNIKSPTQSLDDW